MRALRVLGMFARVPMCTHERARPDDEVSPGLRTPPGDPMKDMLCLKFLAGPSFFCSSRPLASMPRRPTASASDARARQRVSLDVWLHARVASSLLVLQTKSVAFVSDHRDDAADGDAREARARRLRDRRRAERV